MNEARKSCQRSFAERVAVYREQLIDSPARALIELAATTPGGTWISHLIR